MAQLLYSIYTVAVLIVAVAGLLGVAFATPNPGGRSTSRFAVLAVVAALFLVAMAGEFVL